MIRIAIVEDDPANREQLKTYVSNYEKEYEEQFILSVFTDGLDFIEAFHAEYDIVFMDIRMKHLDGMETARKIRFQDQNCIIIFITNLAQYALQGYEVEAMSYVLKPVRYFAFSREMQKAVKKVRGRNTEFLHVTYEGGMIRMDTSRITYIEIRDHNAVYHTVDGDYSSRDPLKNIEKKLEGNHFSRCNQCYLVHLSYVEKVEKNTVVVAGIPLAISRSRKKSFMEELAAYIGRR